MRRTTKAVTSALLVLACAVTPVLAAPTDLEIPDVPFTKFTLPNGLRVIVHEDHKAPIVCVNVWYHVGSKNEKLGKTGFAHLFEHLMFNGSENYNNDWFKIINQLGGTTVNGTTNSDRTNYFQNVPIAALDTVLWLESDRMGHLLGAIDQAKLDEQRGVVKNEKRQGDNQPYGMTQYVIAEKTWPAGHPYSWTVIGSMEDLNAASLSDVQEWFRSYYGAANAVVTIAGDVKADDVRQRVEKFFGHIPSGPPITRPDAWIAKRTGTTRYEMQDRVPQARISLIWNTPGLNTPEDPLLDLAGSVLSDGKSSRLYKRLVTQEQLCTSVNAGQGSREIAGQFSISATARPGASLEKIEKIIREELTKLVTEGPTPEELKLIVNSSLARAIRSTEGIGGFGGKSDLLARSEVFLGSPDGYKKQYAQMKAASPADVQKVAKEWLTDGDFVLTVMPFPKYTTSAPKADRSKPPMPETMVSAEFPQFERRTLANGMEVILVQRKGLPVVNMTMSFQGGAYIDKGHIPGTASLTANLLDEGTKTRDAAKLGDELDALGASIGSSAGATEFSLSLSALKANLDPSLDLFADVLLNPTFPEPELARLKQQQIAGIRRSLLEPQGATSRALATIIYGKDHPYGVSSSGYLDTLPSITREDILRTYDAAYHPNNARLVAVGDISMEELTGKLEKVLSGWKPGTKIEVNIPAVEPKKEKVLYLIDRPGAPQSYIVAAQPVAARSVENDVTWSMANFILGGNFTSRINMNLRENKGWSYGARSGISGGKGTRLFSASAPVQADKTKESVAEMMAEIKGILGSSPITADETISAKNGMILTLPGRWETGNAVADSVESLISWGFPDRYYDTYAKRIAETSPDALNSAVKFIDPDSLTWVVAGDRAKIEKGLKELGFTEIRVIDPDGNSK